MDSQTLSSFTRVLALAQDTRVVDTINYELELMDMQVESLGDDPGIELFCQEFRPHFILVDLDNGPKDPLNLIRDLKHQDPECAIVLLADSASNELISSALQLGAEDFITKPFDPAVIETAMRNILEHRNLRDQVSRLKHELERDHLFGMLVGETPSLVAVRDFIEQVADTDLNVLIRGESGTGKDVTSRLIHQLSNRSEGPFVKVNCAALPENLIESELFGYEKGAFTGAVRAKPGRFQLAHGGTIFLDEISEIPFQLQSKLLQVLEQKEFVRVGGTRNIRVDCRCIAATNVDMQGAIASQRFREDLFFRLNEFSVMLPSLRERRDDIPLLIDYFLSLYSERYQRPRQEPKPDTVRLMMEYPWPGNVRELESLLKRYLVMGSEEIIFQSIGTRPQPAIPEQVTTSHLDLPTATARGASVLQPHPSVADTLTGADPKPDAALVPLATSEPEPAEESSLGNNGEPRSLKEIVDAAVEKAEKGAILSELHSTKWNRRKAAKNLGISYSSLLRRIAKYNLEAV